MATEEKKPEAEKAGEKPADKKAEAAPLTPEEAAAKGKKKRLMILGLVGGIGVLGAGGGAAWFLLKPSPKKEMSAKSHDSDEEEGDEGAAHGEADGHGGDAKGEAKGSAEGGKDKKADAKDSSAAEKPKEDHGGKPAEGHGKAEASGDGKAKAEEGHGKPAEAGHGDGKGKEASAAEEFGMGETLPLKTFHLNLGNPLDNHYIRLEIAVEYKGGETQKKEIERRMPQLREIVVISASRKSREFLLGPDGKAQLRREILIKLNEQMTKPLEAVYITDLLIE